MEIRIDSENRQIIVKKTAISSEIVINEGDALNYKFLAGTEDSFNCILKFLEIEKEDGEKELKPFAQRKDVETWLMELNASDYIF